MRKLIDLGERESIQPSPQLSHLLDSNPTPIGDISRLFPLFFMCARDVLIAGSGYKTAAFLQLLKETAMRPGEACKLTWNDIDLVSKTVRVTPEKGSNPRIFPVSDKLLNMLLSIKQGNHVRDPDRIFAKQLRHVRRYYERVRRKQAYKLQNPRLKRIMLKTFRTWKASACGCR